MRSLNRVFACLPTVTRYQGFQSLRNSGLAAIAAWHCVSSVNDDDSRKTITKWYSNFTKLLHVYKFILMFSNWHGGLSHWFLF